MRLLVPAFLLISLLYGIVPHANAVILNDSNSIDLAPGAYVPPNPDTEEPGISGDSEGGAQKDDSAPGEGGTPQGGTGAPAIEVVEVQYSGALSQGSQAQRSVGAKGGSAENASSAGSSDKTDASDILGTLIGNQALSIKESGEGGGWNVTIHGAGVRDSLAARGIVGFSIPGFDHSGASGLFSDFPFTLRTGEDFALVAASTALKNPRIEDITLALSTLSISYRARARLFAVFPMTYRIRIEVNPDAADERTRIIIRFPWYKFLLQTYVSREGIRTDITTALKAIPENGGVVDARARLVALISDVLQARFDTVEESISVK